jgi:hypothetical protein
MTAVTLGDFLRLANQQFEMAAAGRGRGLTDATGSVHHVRRIVIALSRCFDGCGITEEGQEDRVAIELRRAFTTARAHLEAAEANLGILTSVRPTPRLRILAGAADSLTAGADLIETHTALNAGGRRGDRSEWARVLRSAPVHGALVAETTHWAEQLAVMCSELSGRRALRNRYGCGCLAAAAKCLSEASVTATAVGSEERENWWKLLAGVPMAAPPQRREPVMGESIQELCDGITCSATRLRALAFMMPDSARWAPDISAPAWRRAAQFATSSSQVVKFAVEGAAAGGDASWRVVDLALDAARDSWQQATGVWQVVATDTTTSVSAITIEAEDLLLRMCRLVFQDPEWTTGRTPRLPSRVLAGPRDQSEFGEVLSTLHQAADALAQLAIADRDLIDRFGHQQRLYIQNRILDDEYERSRWHRYLQAPADRVALAVDAYRMAAAESVRAAEVLDELVLRHAAPSTPLALARKAVPRAAGTADLDPADVTNRLRFLDRPKYGRGVPTSQIDSEAVVRAYRDEEFTLQECASKFTTSASNIEKILQASDVPRRPSGSRRTGGNVVASPLPAVRPEPGPVEKEARAAGISDPMVLARAAQMDQTIARARISAATSESQARPRSRTAVEVAAMDQTSSAQASIRTAAPARRTREQPERTAAPRRLG